jgi:hypothetical protein
MRNLNITREHNSEGYTGDLGTRCPFAQTPPSSRKPVFPDSDEEGEIFDEKEIGCG